VLAGTIAAWKPKPWGVGGAGALQVLCALAGPWHAPSCVGGRVGLALGAGEAHARSHSGAPRGAQSLVTRWLPFAERAAGNEKRL
jgi:hypothetical protein